MRGSARTAILQLLLVSITFSGLVPLPYAQASSSPDYTIAFNPSSVVYPQDSSTLMSNVVLSNTNGFSGTVYLDYRWYNGSSDIIFVSLSNPYLTAGGSVSETIKIFSPPLPQTGCCAILGVIGTSGSLSHSANLTIAIPSGPDFSLPAESPSIMLLPGTHGSSTVNVTSTDSVAGRVFFGPAALEAPAVFSGGWSFYLDEAWLNSGGTGSVRFQVYAAPDATPGNYVFNITGTSFSHSHSTAVRVTVVPETAGDFSMSADPSVLIGNIGSTATSSIVLRSINSLAGTVHLSTFEVSQCCMGGGGPIINDPFAPRPSISPSAVNLLPGGSNSSTLTVDTVYPYQHGNYTMEIIASGGTYYHTLNVTVTVPPVPNLFVVTPASQTVYVTPGKTVDSTLTITSDYGFSGSVNLSASSTSPSISSDLNPSSVNLRQLDGYGSSATSNIRISITPATSPGQYHVAVRGVSGPYSYSASITVVVSSTSAIPAQTTAKSSNNVPAILSWPSTVLLAAGGLAAGLIIAIVLLARPSRKKQF